MNKENNGMSAEKVDVKKVFYEKSPNIAKWIPGFVYNLIKRIIHEDFINYLLEKHGHKVGIEFNKEVINEFNVNFKINGEENIPKEGRFIFISNHPLGGFDGMILMHIIKNYFPEFKFLVNDILMNLTNLTPLFLPINKHGKQGRENAEIIHQKLSSKVQILSFPAGMVSRMEKGNIRDLKWYKSFVSQAITYKRDIIPIHFSGHNSKRFYRIYKLRKFFGIKANIEMFLLPDETYRHRNKSFIITFGKAIPYQVFDKRFKHQVWANKVKDYIYTLPNDSSKEFMNY